MEDLLQELVHKIETVVFLPSWPPQQQLLQPEVSHLHI
jgi:hypothetical protein